MSDAQEKIDMRKTIPEEKDPILQEDTAAWEYLKRVRQDYLGGYRAFVAYRSRVVELESECKSLHQQVAELEERCATLRGTVESIGNAHCDMISKMGADLGKANREIRGLKAQLDEFYE